MTLHVNAKVEVTCADNSSGGGLRVFVNSIHRAASGLILEMRREASNRLHGKWGLTLTHPFGERKQRAEVGERGCLDAELAAEASARKKRACRRAEVPREDLQYYQRRYTLDCVSATRYRAAMDTKSTRVRERGLQ